MTNKTTPKPVCTFLLQHPVLLYYRFLAYTIPVKTVLAFHKHTATKQNDAFPEATPKIVSVKY